MSDQSFEKALAELENIVEKMEKGGLALNESLALFEKGVKLARFLREELGKAEKKINILLEDEKGEMKEEPFELEEGGELSEKQETPDSDDDNSLPF
ncbi:MAG: exodeoxyribonuclease VII small subunit [Candidatus Aminicenantes bacterium]|nr:MAG: exodeoxyribonuclease VII small subunit [Candidatus Aminicenantes bacterium]